MSRYVQTNTRRRRLMLQQLNDDLNMIHGGEVNSSDQNVSSDQSGDVSSDDGGDVSGHDSGDVSGDVKGDVNGDVNGDVKGDVSGDVKGDVSGDECRHDCADQDISGKLTSEQWKSLSGDYEVLCQLILVQDHSIECPIMQEPTSLCSLDDLPETWTITNNRNEKSGTENSTANTAKLPCSHTFYAPALAMHFLSSNMRCPVCRAGSPERMNVCCARSGFLRFLIFTTRVDQTNRSTLVKLILFEKSRVELEFVFSIFTTRVRKHLGNSARFSPLVAGDKQISHNLLETPPRR